MIHVDRSAVTPSHGWLSRAEKATAQLASTVERRGKVEHPAWIYRDADLRAALEGLFGTRCAYCESDVGASSSVNIGHFRPSRAAVDLDGATTRPGYWWLAFEWANLYAVCQDCDRNKRDRFPVAGERVTQPQADLASERAVLLDPCLDDPQEHLVFSTDGYVASRSVVEQGIDRGAVTIDVLGLNRHGLVDARRLAAQRMMRRVSEIFRDVARSGRMPLEDMSQLLDRDAPYQAMQLQALSDGLLRLTAKKGEDAAATALQQVEEERDELIVRQQAHEEDRRRTSIEHEPDLEALQSQAIDAIELVNFRGIDELTVRFGGGTSAQAGWTMLLGENGVGKSSVLQALAIALAGERGLARLGRDARPSTLLRRGEREGRIRVRFAADSEPLEVILTRDEIVFEGGASRPRMVVLGFGSARWLPRPGSLPPDDDEFVRIRNLFNPFVPLADTVDWLGEISDQRFARTEEALLRLLQLDAGEQLVRAGDEVCVLAPGKRMEQAVSLRQLSDGYQSVMALVGDVLDLLGRKRIDMAAAEGIVLVDEIGSHLHPRWQMQVVHRLRTAFPRLQFVASTHDPLCLRGLHDDEVCLLRRSRQGRVVRVEELPSVEVLRVEQLLTSPYFGLHSTMDPEVEEQFEEYYALLALDEPTESQECRLAELRERLEGHEQLGTTRREHELLTAIDAHLAREVDALAEGTGELLKEETSQRLADILGRVEREAR